VCLQLRQRFTFVYSRWEGSAYNSRFFETMIMSEEMVFPYPTQGWDLQLIVFLFIHKDLAINIMTKPK
jgi:hypothetical protein